MCDSILHPSLGSMPLVKVEVQLHELQSRATEVHVRSSHLYLCSAIFAINRIETHYLILKSKLFCALTTAKGPFGVEASWFKGQVFHINLYPKVFSPPFCQPETKEFIWFIYSREICTVESHKNDILIRGRLVPATTGVTCCLAT